MASCRKPLLIVGCLLLVGLLTGCGVPNDTAPRPVEIEDTGTPDVPPSPPRADFFTIQQAGITLYFDIDRRDVKLQEVLRNEPGEISAEEVFELLISGPDEVEASGGFITYLPTADEVLDARQEGTNFIVDFADNSTWEELSVQELYFASGQLVLSIIDNTDVETVQVFVAGEPVAIPSFKGDLQRPAVREDYGNLASLPFPLDVLVNPPFPPTAEEFQGLDQ